LLDDLNDVPAEYPDLVLAIDVVTACDSRTVSSISKNSIRAKVRRDDLTSLSLPETIRRQLPP
jgi:hypothetical protein